MKFKGFLKVHSQEISNLQKIIDPIILTLLFNFIVVSPVKENIKDLNLSILILIVFLLILPKTNLYKSCRNKSLIKVSKDLVNTWGWLLASVYGLFFILKVSIYFSRINTLIWSILALFYLFIEHVLIRKLLRIYRIRGGNSKNVIFCGSYDQLENFNKNLYHNPWLGLKTIAWFSLNEETKYNNVPYYKGPLSEFKKIDFKNKAIEIIFSLENSTELEEVLNLLGDTTIPISYFPCWASLDMKFNTDRIGDKFLINLWGHNINSISFLLKRFFDLIFSLVLLLSLSPFLILISFLIKLDSKGPILFKQLRSGVDGKSFYIYKFRTMKHEVSSENKQIKQATKFDHRITKIGKFLRKSSIDELPQLINVVRGEMSVIGPRPHAVEHNDYYRKYIRGYMQRHFFKPGMTGLAQINGFRGETKDLLLMEQRIKNDLTYINNWSFLLDLEILIKTSYKFVSNRAY